MFNFVLLILLLISGCSSGNKPAPTAVEPLFTSPPSLSEVSVKSVKVNVFGTFPIRVNATIRGELLDSCLVLDQFIPDRKDHTFAIQITTLRQTERPCQKLSKSFDLVVPLEVDNLPAGSYTVNVHGVTDNFELSVDNRVRK